MNLPGADRAFVAPSKVRDYLLSDSHPVGRFKATFFAGLGYTAGAWKELADDLTQHAQGNEAVLASSSKHGQKYEVGGTLEGPAGKRAIVVAVWIVLHSEEFPRFVTAFPGVKR